jgi:hypothetical protein
MGFLTALSILVRYVEGEEHWDEADDIAEALEVLKGTLETIDEIEEQLEKTNFM